MLPKLNMLTSKWSNFTSTNVYCPLTLFQWYCTIQNNCKLCRQMWTRNKAKHKYRKPPNARPGLEGITLYFRAKAVLKVEVHSHEIGLTSGKWKFRDAAGPFMIGHVHHDHTLLQPWLTASVNWTTVGQFGQRLVILNMTVSVWLQPHLDGSRQTAIFGHSFDEFMSYQATNQGTLWLGKTTDARVKCTLPVAGQRQYSTETLLIYFIVLSWARSYIVGIILGFSSLWLLAACVKLSCKFRLVCWLNSCFVARSQQMWLHSCQSNKKNKQSSHFIALFEQQFIESPTPTE